MSGCPTADLSAATTASNGLEHVRLKRSTSTFAIVISFSATALKKKGATDRAGIVHRRLGFQEGPDVADEQFVVLKQGAVAGIGIEDQLGAA